VVTALIHTMSARPEKVGKYPILSEIGRGASAIVYLAEDPFNQRRVAIKAANFQSHQDEEVVRRFRKLFLNEASLAGKLVHPNIVAVYDAVVDEAMSYLVMEYVPGGTLKRFCHASRLLPIQQVVMITFKLCRAMDYAFQRGIIHRDLKPANILLSEKDDIKISDFGTAQIATNTQTQLQGFIGSPAYMAPEAIAEKQPTQQSDIYSMGVVLYELLAGKLPFTAESGAAMLNKILNDEPIDIRSIRPDIPQALVDIVNKAMRKDLALRFANWFDMAKDLAESFNNLDNTGVQLNATERFNRVRELTFFQAFSDQQIWEVLRGATWDTHKKGENLVLEGDIGHAFFVMISGEAYVTREGRLLSPLRKGDCFGEMAYLNQAAWRRTATITATNDCELLRIQLPQLEKLSDSCQLQFMKVFLQTLIERLSMTTDMLAQLRL
jgi:eukaryotic-like serine/threonine-protein kinase